MDFYIALNGHRKGTPNPFLTCMTGWVSDNSQEERKFTAKTCSHRKPSVNKTKTYSTVPLEKAVLPYCSSPPLPALCQHQHVHGHMLK